MSNASTNGNHWLYVRLDGPTDNTTGIGASLYATINEGTPQERTLRREANTNAGTFNQSDLPVHFGLGAATVIDELRIEWPDGTVQTLYDVATNQYLTVWTPGDFDGDGEVDAADLAEWRGDFGVNGGSDSDGDGDSDGADFLFWQRQLGNGQRAVAVNTAVPEPGAGPLAAAAMLAVLAASVSRPRLADLASSRPATAAIAGDLAQPSAMRSVAFGVARCVCTGPRTGLAFLRKRCLPRSCGHARVVVAFAARAYTPMGRTGTDCGGRALEVGTSSAAGWHGAAWRRWSRPAP